MKINQHDFVSARSYARVSTGEVIHILREKKGWTQEDLAREIDVSLSTVQRWEGKGANPTRLASRELKKLFRAAGIDDE